MNARAIAIGIAVALVVQGVHAQCLLQSGNGNVAPGNCPLPTEEEMDILCSPYTDPAGNPGSRCTMFRGPIRKIEDPNGLPYATDPRFTTYRPGFDFDGSEPDDNVFGLSIAANFLGALTPSAIFAQQGFTFDHPPIRHSFVVDGFVLADGTKRWIRGDGSMSTSRNDGEFVAMVPCPEIRAVTITVLNDSGVRTALPANATWNLIFDVNDPGGGGNGSVACSVAAGADSGTCTSPPAGLGWVVAKEIGRAMRCDGTGCSGTYDAEVAWFCY